MNVKTYKTTLDQIRHKAKSADIEIEMELRELLEGFKDAKNSQEKIFVNPNPALNKRIAALAEEVTIARAKVVKAEADLLEAKENRFEAYEGLHWKGMGKGFDPRIMCETLVNQSNQVQVKLYKYLFLAVAWHCTFMTMRDDTTEPEVKVIKRRRKLAYKLFRKELLRAVNRQEVMIRQEGD